jgi:hypothetical protein
LPGARRDGHYALSHEVKASKKGTRAEMTGTAEVHKKLDKRLAELAKLARKFVDAGLPVAVTLAV